jgi:hypothetical protein
MEVLKKKDPFIFLTKLLKLTILKPWRNARIRYGLIVKIYTYFRALQKYNYWVL